MLSREDFFSKNKFFLEEIRVPTSNHGRELNAKAMLEALKSIPEDKLSVATLSTPYYGMKEWIIRVKSQHTKEDLELLYEKHRKDWLRRNKAFITRMKKYDEALAAELKEINNVIENLGLP